MDRARIEASRLIGTSPVLTGSAVLLAALLTLHGLVPDLPGRPGSLLETFLPWLGVSVPLLVAAAVLRRSAVASFAALLPVAAWLALFGALPLPGTDGKGAAPGAGDGRALVVVQHNVADDNPDPAGTARTLAAAGADLIAMEELTPAALPSYRAVLASGYPHHTVRGTVGLWSRYPLVDARPVDIRPAGVGPDWNRGLRATARTPQGDVAVYVAHLPSLRIGAHGFGSARRDESAVRLGAAVAAEPSRRVLLLGDLNGTVDDRGLAPLTSRLTAPGSGFAFSWPERFPLARIDQVLARSATVTRVWSLPRTGSDHLPVAARVTL